MYVTVWKRFPQKSAGFTLIELLVVIAIIAVLAAILFPVFTQAKASAQRASCESNLKQMATACLMYADNYNGRTPGSMWVACRWGDKRGWTERLAPYMGNKGGPGPTKGEHKVYQCPASKNVDYSYGITDYEFPDTGLVNGVAHSGGIIISRLKYPSRQMLFYDLRPRGLSEGLRGETGQSNDLQKDGPSYYKHPFKPNMINGPAYDYCVYWPGSHGGNAFALTDGHVIYLTDWNSKRLTYTDSPPAP